MLDRQADIMWIPTFILTAETTQGKNYVLHFSGARGVIF
jgi:hypothetical protein